MKIVEITEFCDEYFDSARALFRQLAPDAPPLSDAALEAVVLSGGSHLFFAMDGKVVAGMTTVALYDIPSCRRAWIEDVVVHEKYRGQGLGRALVTHGLEFAKENMASCVMLTSNPRRTAANELYRSMGFELRETNLYIMRIKG